MEEMIKKFYEEVDKNLAKKIISVIENEESGIRWFYSPNLALGKKSPSELYDAGKVDEIETILERIEYGVYS